jgi:regulatory protein
MRQKGLSDALIAQTLQNLSATEQTRAYSVWEKKFSTEGRPTDARSWARQARFLASRGFGSGVIRQVLGSSGSGEEDP